MKVLEEGDELRWQVRVAALEVIAQDLEHARARAKRGG